MAAWGGRGSVLGATRQQRERPCERQNQASYQKLFFRHTATSQVAPDMTAFSSDYRIIECPVNESVG
jgi:hypothetical protein